MRENCPENGKTKTQEIFIPLKINILDTEQNKQFMFFVIFKYISFI